MKERLLLLALLMLGNAPVWAEQPAECRVAENLLESSFRLPQVTRAIAAKHLTVLVMGAGSSQLPGPNGAANGANGAGNAYPVAAATGTCATTARCRGQSYNRR